MLNTIVQIVFVVLSYINLVKMHRVVIKLVLIVLVVWHIMYGGVVIFQAVNVILIIKKITHILDILVVLLTLVIKAVQRENVVLNHVEHGNVE